MACSRGVVRAACGVVVAVAWTWCEGGYRIVVIVMVVVVVVVVGGGGSGLATVDVSLEVDEPKSLLPEAWLREYTNSRVVQSLTALLLCDRAIFGGLGCDVMVSGWGLELACALTRWLLGVLLLALEVTKQATGIAVAAELVGGICGGSLRRRCTCAPKSAASATTAAPSCSVCGDLPVKNGCLEASRGVIRFSGSHTKQRLMKSTKSGFVARFSASSSDLFFWGLVFPRRSFTGFSFISSVKNAPIRFDCLSTDVGGRPRYSTWYMSCSASQ